MRHHILLITLVVALTSLGLALDTSACSCMWKGPFLEMAAGSELVIHGKVIDYGKRLPHGDDLFESMTVEVVEVIKGEYKSKTITILGDRGADCRPYITPRTFGKSKEFLFALSATDKKVQPISVCGEFWIPVEAGVAKGVDMRVNEPYSIPLDELVVKITAHATEAEKDAAKENR